jgi:hypothetical protein
VDAWRRLTPAKQCLAVAAVALVGYVVVLFAWGSTSHPTSQVGPRYVDGRSSTGGFTPLLVVGGGLIFLAVVMLLFTIVTLLQARGPRFEDLSSAEQERRREAGRLLKGDAAST